MDDTKLAELQVKTTEVFRNELHTLQTCRSLVRNSKNRVPHEFYVQLNAVNFDLISIGLKDLIQQDRDHIAGSRQTMLAWCTNYFIILNKLLQLYQNRDEDLVKTMWHCYTCAKKCNNFSPVEFEEERILYFFYRLIYKKHYKFDNFHKHAIYQLVLNEYRLRNGCLIGKYRFEWKPDERDENFVYIWAIRQNTIPTRLGAGFHIRELHHKALGQEINGM